jgi:hypothetical protein
MFEDLERPFPVTRHDGFDAGAPKHASKQFTSADVVVYDECARADLTERHERPVIGWHSVSQALSSGVRVGTGKSPARWSRRIFYRRIEPANRSCFAQHSNNSNAQLGHPAAM